MLYEDRLYGFAVAAMGAMGWGANWTDEAKSMRALIIAEAMEAAFTATLKARRDAAEQAAKKAREDAAGGEVA